jgi:hypothetical protein
LAKDERALREDVLDWVWVVFAHQGRYATAARWFAEAFRADPSLLSGLPTRCRYSAACAAARAGCGPGRDTAELDEETRAAFRRQALDWLRAELKARHRLLEQEPEKAGPTVALDLRAWLGDDHFDGVREAEALARLPEPERQAWQKLWADIADTLARAEGTTPPEPKAGRRLPTGPPPGPSVRCARR